MKRQSLLIALLILFTDFSFSQETIKQFYIEPYIGGPNPGIYLNNELASGGYDGGTTGDQSTYWYETDGSPVVYGLKLEYLTKHQFGIGFEINFQETIINKIYYGTYFDINIPQLVGYNGVQVLSEVKLRYMARIQYHFGKDDKIDYYLGGGIGFTHRRYAIISKFHEPTFFGRLLGISNNIPIALRTYYGARHMIIPNLWLNLEIGIGSGALFNGAITFAF
jgi:hypothetical protein